MSRTLTNQIPLGFRAIDFKLIDVVTDKKVGLQDVANKNGLVVMFICNHCPYVVHVIDQIVELSNNYLKKDIGFVAISSNDIENYPDDGPSKMKLFAKERKFKFPYLYDESQEIAKAYDAACTPDFNVFNEKLVCVYRGQLDESRPGNESKVDGKDLRLALDYVLDLKEIDFIQKPSIGCNIKWK